LLLCLDSLATNTLSPRAAPSLVGVKVRGAIHQTVRRRREPSANRKSTSDNKIDLPSELYVHVAAERVVSCEIERSGGSMRHPSRQDWREARRCRGTFFRLSASYSYYRVACLTPSERGPAPQPRKRRRKGTGTEAAIRRAAVGDVGSLLLI
jgi:hypothetical protein